MEIKRINNAIAAIEGEIEKIAMIVDNRLKKTNQGDSIKNHQLNGNTNEPYSPHL